jgi:hypothetical protein
MTPETATRLLSNALAVDCTKVSPTEKEYAAILTVIDDMHIPLDNPDYRRKVTSWWQIVLR